MSLSIDDIVSEIAMQPMRGCSTTNSLIRLVDLKLTSKPKDFERMLFRIIARLDNEWQRAVKDRTEAVRDERDVIYRELCNVVKRGDDWYGFTAWLEERGTNDDAS